MFYPSSDDPWFKIIYPYSGDPWFKIIYPYSGDPWFNIIYPYYYDPWFKIIYPYSGDPHGSRFFILTLAILMVQDFFYSSGKLWFKIFAIVLWLKICMLFPQSFAQIFHPLEILGSIYFYTHPLIFYPLLAIPR